MRSPARVQALGPRAVGQVLDDPARLAAADPERADQLVFRQPVQLAGRGDRAEGPGQGGRVIVARVELARHREAYATHHLDAGDDRLERRPPAGARRLARGQAGRDDDRARVNDGVLARVVEVEPVGERGVCERRVGRGHAHGAPDQAAFRRPAEPLRGGTHRAGEVILRGGETAAERVEREEAGPPYDRRGHVLQPEIGDEAREPPRSGGHHALPSPRTVRSTSRMAPWIWPLLATRAGASRSSVRPVRLVTRPPASSTRRLPAATSQEPSRSSQ